MDKRKILIVDDAELNREVLSEMLGDQYTYIFARDGIEALDAMTANLPDLVLLDLNMPKMDGMSVLRVMNENHWIEETSVIVISSEDDNKTISQAFQFGAVDFLSHPFRDILVQNRVRNTLLLTENQKKLVRIVENQVQEREKTNNAMINIFSNVIELRNHESGTHTLNVQNITGLLLHRLAKITDKYHIRESDISLISSLAALHDIGKIKIPENILNKPGKLTEEEWDLMKTHTTAGDEILSHKNLDQDSVFVRTARSICRWHHEKYDGNGYPDGLVGDEIPIAAQVVSLADAYEALTSERCYKPAYSHEKALDMLFSGECGVFNPLLIQCLKDVAKQLKTLIQSADYNIKHDESLLVVKELFEDNNLPKHGTLRTMLNNESIKKYFFMERCNGISFEYDKLLHRTTYIYPQEDGSFKRKVTFVYRDSGENCITPELWDELYEKLQNTTRDNPTVETDVPLRIDGKFVPHHITLLAVWPENGTEYSCVLGLFTPNSSQK